MQSLKELLTEAEQRWHEALEAHRKAVEADNSYREALKKWYEQQGGDDADTAPKDSSS